MSSIKRSVSLYSFQEEYFLGKLDLQSSLKTLQALDVPGVEVIGEQMFNGFPNLADTQVADWEGWLRDYALTPVCHDMFLDTKRYKHRLLTFEESVESVVRDIRFAARLGCTRIRVLVITPPEVMAACVRYAERYNVRLLLEIHSPWNFQNEWILKHIDVIEKMGSPFLGLMPDLGIFVRRFPRIIRDRFVRDGATPGLADEVVAAYDAKADLAALPGEIAKRGGNEKDVAFAHAVGHYCDVNPRDMLEHMSAIQHIHAKFYEMLPDGTEYSIPYAEIISVLQEGGYDGYMSSEYEGNRHIQDVFEVDSIEQVTRHQAMLKRLIAETANTQEGVRHV